MSNWLLKWVWKPKMIEWLLLKSVISILMWRSTWIFIEQNIAWVLVCWNRLWSLWWSKNALRGYSCFVHFQQRVHCLIQSFIELDACLRLFLSYVGASWFWWLHFFSISLWCLRSAYIFLKWLVLNWTMKRLSFIIWDDCVSSNISLGWIHFVSFLFEEAQISSLKSVSNYRSSRLLSDHQLIARLINSKGFLHRWIDWMTDFRL